MDRTYLSTILLVEDDRAWQTMLTGYCQDAGFRVVQAFDVIAAKHHLQSTSKLPILAVVDLHLRNSIPAQEYEGLQFLNVLRDYGIYAIVVSGNIPKVQEALTGRPEIRHLVDKAHFDDQDFGTEVFMSWVREAMHYATTAQHAEGQAPEQQARMHRLESSLDDHD